MIYKIYKNIGETPLQAIDRLKQNLKSSDAKIAYACRLDPLAEGVILALTDKDRFLKEELQKSDKIYELGILFGLSTDTGDLLGLLKKFDNKRVDLSSVENILKNFEGDIELRYPVFSAKTLRGKKLFELYLDGDLKDDEIPKYKSCIKKIKLKERNKIKADDLLSYIENKLSKVRKSSIKSKFSDFRKEKVLKKWRKVLLENREVCFEYIVIEVHSCSGLFMRQLANLVAKRLGTVGLAQHIKRLDILIDGFEYESLI